MKRMEAFFARQNYQIQENAVWKASFPCTPLPTANPGPLARGQTSLMRFALIVIPLGFEPKTHSLEGCCSIQLSYGTIPAKGDCKVSEKSSIYNFFFAVFHFPYTSETFPAVMKESICWDFIKASSSENSFWVSRVWISKESLREKPRLMG